MRDEDRDSGSPPQEKNPRKRRDATLRDAVSATWNLLYASCTRLTYVNDGVVYFDTPDFTYRITHSIRGRFRIVRDSVTKSETPLRRLDNAKFLPRKCGGRGPADGSHSPLRPDDLLYHVLGKSTLAAAPQLLRNHPTPLTSHIVIDIDERVYQEIPPARERLLALTSLLGSCAVPCAVQTSPGGGYHVTVPLADSAPVDRAGAAAKALVDRLGHLGQGIDAFPDGGRAVRLCSGKGQVTADPTTGQPLPGLTTLAKKKGRTHHQRRIEANALAFLEQLRDCLSAGTTIADVERAGGMLVPATPGEGTTAETTQEQPVVARPGRRVPKSVVPGGGDGGRSSGHAEKGSEGVDIIGGPTWRESTCSRPSIGLTTSADCAPAVPTQPYAPPARIRGDRCGHLLYSDAFWHRIMQIQEMVVVPSNPLDECLKLVYAYRVLGWSADDAERVVVQWGRERGGDVRCQVRMAVRRYFGGDERGISGGTLDLEEGDCGVEDLTADEVVLYRMMERGPTTRARMIAVLPGKVSRTCRRWRYSVAREGLVEKGLVRQARTHVRGHRSALWVLAARLRGEVEVHEPVVLAPESVAEAVGATESAAEGMIAVQSSSASSESTVVAGSVLEAPRMADSADLTVEERAMVEAMRSSGVMSALLERFGVPVAMSPSPGDNGGHGRNPGSHSPRAALRCAGAAAVRERDAPDGGGVRGGGVICGDSGTEGAVVCSSRGGRGLGPSRGVSLLRASDEEVLACVPAEFWEEFADDAVSAELVREMAEVAGRRGQGEAGSVTGELAQDGVGGGRCRGGLRGAPADRAGDLGVVRGGGPPGDPGGGGGGVPEEGGG